MKSVLFVQTPTVFQAAAGANVQNSFDLAGNALVNSGATTASLFTAFPATVTPTTPVSAFDWTPAAGSAAAAGGLATFTGKLGAAVSGTTIAGTTYVGAAAPGGTKWWTGWTTYSQN